MDDYTSIVHCVKAHSCTDRLVHDDSNTEEPSCCWLCSTLKTFLVAQCTTRSLRIMSVLTCEQTGWSTMTGTPSSRAVAESLEHGRHLSWHNEPAGQPRHCCAPHQVPLGTSKLCCCCRLRGLNPGPPTKLQCLLPAWQCGLAHVVRETEALREAPPAKQGIWVGQGWCVRFAWLAFLKLV